MKRSLLIVLLATACVLGVSRTGAAATAAEIVAWCDAGSPEHSLPLCRSYLEAIATTAARPNRMEDRLGVACFPSDTPLNDTATLDGLAEVVLSELRADAGLTDVSGFDAVAPILIRMYPCP